MNFPLGASPVFVDLYRYLLCFICLLLVNYDLTFQIILIVMIFYKCLQLLL